MRSELLRKAPAPGSSCWPRPTLHTQTTKACYGKAPHPKTPALNPLAPRLYAEAQPAQHGGDLQDANFARALVPNTLREGPLTPSRAMSEGFLGRSVPRRPRVLPGSGTFFVESAEHLKKLVLGVCPARIIRGRSSTQVVTTSRRLNPSLACVDASDVACTIPR